MRGNAETAAKDHIKRRRRTKSSADNNGRFASGSAQTPVAAAFVALILYRGCSPFPARSGWVKSVGLGRVPVSAARSAADLFKTGTRLMVI